MSAPHRAAASFADAFALLHLLIALATVPAAAQTYVSAPECPAVERYIKSIVADDFSDTPQEILDEFTITLRTGPCADVMVCKPEEIILPAQAECDTVCCGTTTAPHTPNVCFNTCEETVALIADALLPAGVDCPDESALSGGAPESAAAASGAGLPAAAGASDSSAPPPAAASGSGDSRSSPAEVAIDSGACAVEAAAAAAAVAAAVAAQLW